MCRLQVVTSATSATGWSDDFFLHPTLRHGEGDINKTLTSTDYNSCDFSGPLQMVVKRNGQRLGIALWPCWPVLWRQVEH